MKIKTLYQALVLALLFSMSSFVATGSAESFPFRAIEPGDTLPPISLSAVDTSATLEVSSLAGSPLLMVFWGGDLETKKKRAILALRGIEELRPLIKNKKFNLLIVNAQGDNNSIIDEVKGAAGIDVPFYMDSEQKAYADLGIFVMPSILLVDANNKVVTGMGYSKNMTARLRGEIEILSGDKTRAQVEAELNPKMVEKPKTEKDANRHLNMGKSMVKKGQLESALREFTLASEKNPNMGEAYVEMGCLYFKLKDLEKAQANLDKGYDLLPDSVQGEICQAQLTAEEGKVDEAIDDLIALLFRNGRNHTLRHVLGQLYLKQGNNEKAAAELEKAYSLLLRRENID